MDSNGSERKLPNRRVIVRKTGAWPGVGRLMADLLMRSSRRVSHDKREVPIAELGANGGLEGAAHQSALLRSPARLVQEL